MFPTAATSHPRPLGELEGIEMGYCNNCGYYGGYTVRFVSAKAVAMGGLKGCMVVLCEYCAKTCKGPEKMAALCQGHEFHN